MTTLIATVIICRPELFQPFIVPVKLLPRKKEGGRLFLWFLLLCSAFSEHQDDDQPDDHDRYDCPCAYA